jgi:hypothetical protein
MATMYLDKSPRIKLSSGCWKVSSDENVLSGNMVNI